MADANAGRVAGALASLEREKATGLLRVGADGAFHVDRGAVTLAESRHAPGPGDLPDGPDPELAALLAMFDAACLLLASRAEPEFTEGPPGGGPRRVTVATLVHEQRRRRALLDAAWPDGSVDVAPVVPVRRVTRQRVILTGLQAEILLNADGRRTPPQLARELGRTVFACLLAVRGLAAASLLRIGPPDGFGAAPVREAPAAPVRDAPAAPVRDDVPAGWAPADWAPADHDLLVRLHAALVELR
ncbi:hypothetical protein GCM10010402_28100 [Actinomadura luteofluorescens]|uniref:hypothetical protein n=1 Tax=Actinomadura luteofluorescens TaxID=46163 RepID=UPI0021646BFA|nr:hypothetical protein [Actinomadura glauciflava]MCR3745497.1 hypothetical protein [Actinomadura glauciflava]